MSAMTITSLSSGILDNVGLSRNLMTDPLVRLATIKQGVPGSTLKAVVTDFYPSEREIFCEALHTASSNLSRLYRRKLDKQKSEEFIDTMAVYLMAQDLYDGDKALALELLNTNIPALNSVKPVDLLDTFEGRRIVKEYLSKLGWGEFS